MPSDCCGTADTTADEEHGTVTMTDGGVVVPPESEALLERSLPGDLAEELAAVYGTDAVETYSDWLRAVAGALDREPTTDDMCCVDDALHTVEIDGEREAYICVIDPLMVPFLEGEQAVIRSEAPVSGERVVAWVDPDGEVSVTPEDAVVSIGASRSAGTHIDDPVERGYVMLCEYVHAFPDRESYGVWAAGTEAVTTSIEYGEAVTLSQAVAEGFENRRGRD